MKCREQGTFTAILFLSEVTWQMNVAWCSGCSDAQHVHDYTKPSFDATPDKLEAIKAYRKQMEARVAQAERQGLKPDGGKALTEAKTSLGTRWVSLHHSMLRSGSRPRVRRWRWRLEVFCFMSLQRYVGLKGEGVVKELTTRLCRYPASLLMWVVYLCIIEF